MKNIKYLLVALMVTPMFIIGTGCGGDEVVPEPQDTTPVVQLDSPTAGFTASFDNYQLVVDQSKSSANYQDAAKRTSIVIVGESHKGHAGSNISDKAEIEITFDGDKTGVFTESTPGFLCSIKTGEGAKETEFQTAGGSSFILEVTKYGGPGEMIEGTFSGTMKAGISSKQFTKGYFKMQRRN